MKRNVIGCMLGMIAVLASTGAMARQTLYHQTEDGWYIYVEEKSCVAYIDHEYDDNVTTMMRISSRVDEGRAYFSIVSENWTMLEDLKGQTLSLYIGFPESKKVYGSSGLVMVNPDGRLGFTAADFSINELQTHIGKEDEMLISARLDEKTTLDIAAVNISGSGPAMNALEKCTQENFSTGKNKTG